MANRGMGNGMKSFLIFLATFLLVILIAVAAIGLMLKNWLDSGAPAVTTAPDLSALETTLPEEEETQPPETTLEETTLAAPPSSEFTEKSVTEADVHKGDLVLVNRIYEYVFPEKSNVTELYGKRSTSYQLSSSNIKLQKKVITALNDLLDAFVEQGGNDDIIVTGGYRDKEEQSVKYNDYVAKHGEEQNEVSPPSAADRHTGLGVDLKVFNDKGVMFKLDEAEIYNWVGENCHRYGFVLRYPPSKTDLTGIAYTEAKYLRYVGAPHAEIMVANDLCLEEYVLFLRNYPADGEHLLFDSSDGRTYELYHASFDSTSPTILVPKDKPYTLSGDNIDGFLVSFAY